MTLDLEKLLADLDAGELNLADRLERVRRSAERIWQVQRLHWFTDHTATRHSRRVISLCGALLERLQNTDEALNRSELFVLLAAAYLHDIGMQDFVVDGRGGEALTVKDYKLIRARHPERGRQLIMDRALNLEVGRDSFEIDLDDRLEYLLPIAIVSEGHGSSYFETAIQELSADEYAPENVPLRGALLAALLLIADELDLHEDRASFPLEMDQSPITAMHHHLNHYVTRVEVRAGEPVQKRVIRISFAYPHGSEEYRFEVRRYVVDKLVRQVRRVNPVIESATHGELALATRIVVRERIESAPGARREMPEPALTELRAEMREDGLVGRQPVVAQLKDALRGEVHGPFDIAASDESDLPLVLRWLEAYASQQSAVWVHLSFTTTVASEPEDIARRLAVQLGDSTGGGETMATDESDVELAGAVGSSITAMLRSVGASVVVLEAVDNLEPRSQAWLGAEVAQVRAGSPSTVIVMTRSDRARPIVDSTELRLDAISQEQLEGHLRASFGYTSEEASTEAREMTLLSHGLPARVLAALAERRLGQSSVET